MPNKPIAVDIFSSRLCVFILNSSWASQLTKALETPSFRKRQNLFLLLPISGWFWCLAKLALCAAGRKFEDRVFGIARKKVAGLIHGQYRGCNSGSEHAAGTGGFEFHASAFFCVRGKKISRPVSRQSGAYAPSRGESVLSAVWGELEDRSRIPIRREEITGRVN